MISAARDTMAWCNPAPMPAPDVLFATNAEWSALFEDDHPARDGLTAHGLLGAAAVWDDPAVDWASAKIVVLRSVFDYVAKRDRFLDWIETTAKATPVHNPPDLVRWNSHKGYLTELEASGIPIIPTAWPKAGSTLRLADLMNEHGWDSAVVKPAVGNGGREAVRVTAGDDIAKGQALIDELLPARDLMIQPYIAATEDPGEHAIIHFDGRFSHAVRKDQMLAGRPFSMERVLPVQPSDAERALAQRVLQQLGDPPLYARVDVVTDGDVVRLMELEVIEPVLFLQKSDGAAQRFADAIARRVQQ